MPTTPRRGGLRSADACPRTERRTPSLEWRLSRHLGVRGVSESVGQAGMPRPTEQQRQHPLCREEGRKRCGVDQIRRPAEDGGRAPSVLAVRTRPCSANPARSCSTGTSSVAADRHEPRLRWKVGDLGDAAGEPLAVDAVDAAQPQALGLDGGPHAPDERGGTGRSCAGGRNRPNRPNRREQPQLCLRRLTVLAPPDDGEAVRCASRSAEGSRPVGDRARRFPVGCSPTRPLP